MLKRTFSLLSVFLFFSGCATYQPKPITPEAMSSALAPPSTQTLAIDPTKPLSPQDLAVLAVLGNPDLQALRAQQGVANAQVFSAGLLPDPVFSANWGFPIHSSGSVLAYSYGVNFNVASLVTRHLQVEASQAQSLQTQDNIAWQEWLIANQAHLLALRISYLQVQLQLAKQNLAVATEIMNFTRNNLLSHDMTLTDWSLRQSAYFDAEDQVTTLARSLDADKIALNQLLGFPPDTKLVLASPSVSLPNDLNAADLFIQAQNVRLDLKALQAGYQNQEIQLHQAILGQYPGFNLGLTEARDNSNVNSIGPNLSFDLPIWNRNRGQIAIQTATREQLYQEYIARLKQTRADIATAVSDINFLESEVKDIESSNVGFSQNELAQAFASGQIDLATYADLSNSVLVKQQRLLALQQSLAEQCVAVQIAVGTTIKGLSC